MKVNNLFKALVLSVACSFSAQAAMTQIDVTWYNDFTTKLVAQGNNHFTLASAIRADRIGGDALPGGHSNPFVTFCLDVNTVLADGWWVPGSMEDPTLTAQSAGAQRLEDSLYRAANLYAHYSGGLLANNQFVNKKAGSALQLAIWEVLYENPESGFSLDQGSGSGFYVTEVDSEVRSLANDMLSSAYTSPDYNLGTTFWNAVFQDGSSRASQDLIGPFSAVPEPATVAAGALLVLPFLASMVNRFRRR
jgi:hypothetical protein